MQEAASVSVQPTERQLREIAYHREHAEKAAHRRTRPVGFDVVENPKRRWWNAYWTTYTLLRGHDLAGKRVLVPGCGFGEDAVRLARMGARVHAFDLSPEIVEITRARVAHLGVANVEVRVMASEALDYPDDFFDAVFFLDILHHVDIPRTMAEVRRVTRAGGWLVGNELYTHSLLQRHIRESWVVRKVLYSKLQGFIYHGRDPYITEDEHKIDEAEFQVIRDSCESLSTTWFNLLTGRLFPDSFVGLTKLDRLMLKATGDLGRFTAGRVVFEGRVRE